MPTTDELSDDIKAAQVRLGRMRQAVDNLDRRIKTLGQQEAAAAPRDRAKFAQEIRMAGEQRLNAQELFAEAEVQLADRIDRLSAAMATAKRELGKTAKLCTDAADRFDRAMREAAKALGEIEQAGDPIRPFLPNGVGHYTHMRNVNAALRHAFADRLGPAERMTERKSMAERIGEMISCARHNSAAHDGRCAA